MTNKIQQQSFILKLAGICLVYLIMMLLYNRYAMLSVDEFWFGHFIYRYKSGLPYRDFAPYKTVLGYYLLLTPMLSGRGIMQTLMTVKDVLAILNVFIFFVSSLWLSRFFSRTGVLLSLLALLSSEIVLSYSTQLRVDLPGYWFCFFALLFFLENRFLAAGILMGLGFASTQKSIWYIFAVNCAFMIQWLAYDRKIKNLINLITFNAGCAVVILVYLALWSWVADWHTVIHSVFYEASAMYHLDWYDSARWLFWESIILNNPLLFLLWPLTVISLCVTYENDAHFRDRLFIVSLSWIILLSLIPYKQVFPYYMQVTFPVFFILYASFASWCQSVLSPKCEFRLLAPVWLIIAFLFIYLAALAALIAFMQLPDAYLLFCLLPISLITYLVINPAKRQSLRNLFQSLILLSAFFIGLVYPLSQLPARLINLNGNYQKANLSMMNALLASGGDYVAGIELIYNKNQPIPGMRHLMGPAIDYLYKPTPRLRTVMLASLYEDPDATTDSVIQAFQSSSVKFYVNNYRMNALPGNIKQYLHSQYEHWWGSIYLYAPLIQKGKCEVAIKFSGEYLIAADSSGKIDINGRTYKQGDKVHLQNGTISSSADTDYRLEFLPDLQGKKPDPRFQNDDWNKMMY